MLFLHELVLRFKEVTFDDHVVMIEFIMRFHGNVTGARAIGTCFDCIVTAILDDEHSIRCTFPHSSEVVAIIVLQLIVNKIWKRL